MPAEPHPVQPDPSSGDGAGAPPRVSVPPSAASELEMAAAQNGALAAFGDRPANGGSAGAAPSSSGSQRLKALQKLSTAALPGRPASAAVAGPWRQFVTRLNERTRRRRARKAEAETYSTAIVEPDDSLAAICGKLDACRLQQVAVLIPHANQELSRPLGVRRLMRHADLTGKDMILVTRNLGIRQRAHAEGQPVSGSLRRVRFQRLSRRGLQLGGLDLALPGLGSIVALLVFVAFLAAAFVAVFWYLPVATVTLYPRATIATKVQTLTIDSQATQLDAAKFIVPAVRRQTNVSRTLYVPATGVVNVKQANGKLLPVPAVSAKDLAFAQSLAPAALTEQGLSSLKSQYGSIDTIFPESAQVQVLSVNPKQKVGDATSFIEVTVSGSVSMLAAANADLRLLFTSLLRPAIQSDQALINSSFHTSVQAAGPFDQSADKLPARIAAQVGVSRALNPQALEHAIEGMSLSGAAAYLDRIVAPVKPPAVKVSPGWAPWLPRTSKHVHIDLRAAGTS